MDYYNTERLHSAIGYIAPKDKLDGRAEAIWAERDRKLAEARERRRVMRRQQRDRQKIEGKELTFRKEGKTISLAGQTEAGSAGAQPARDSRLGCGRKTAGGTTDERCSPARLSPFSHFPHALENSNVPKATDPLKPEDHCSNSG